jgi:hypothetical protein
MGYYKLNTDGTIQSRSKQVDNTWLPLSDLATKEDGSYYTYYNVDGTPDLAKIMLEDKANTLQAMESAVQEYIDSQAKNRGYDSIVSACSYAGYTNEFQTEAVSLGVWRSAAWTKAYQVQADVEAGTIPMPTVDELIAMLPIFGA